MNSFRKCCSNNFKYTSNRNLEKKIMDAYYNVYSVGYGLDLFAKGKKIKKIVDILKSIKR